MKVSTYASVTTTVRLDKHECWQARNDQNRLFTVDSIWWGGGKRVNLRGWAIKADGTQGFIHRDVSIQFTNLPSLYQEALKMDRSITLINLVGEDS